MPSRSNSRPIASARALRPLIGRTITISSATLPSASKRSRSSPSTLAVADPRLEDQRRSVAVLELVDVAEVLEHVHRALDEDGRHERLPS